jgi:hypothetical protein
VEIATAIRTDQHSHILLYGANIGAHSAPLSYRHTAPALFPHRYPASDAPIQLSTVNSSFLDKDAEFWAVEAKNLTRKMQQRVRERIATGDIDHLSVFALAPQPLLILLGTMLGDIIPSDVYQLHREPAGWVWPQTIMETPTFEIGRPDRKVGPPALVLALSGTVATDRIIAAAGESASLWTISVPMPHNDVIIENYII